MPERGQIVVTITCGQCGEEQPPFRMTHMQLLAWRQGEFIQRVLPDESPGRRELLISGTCERCFDSMFGSGA